MNKVFLANVIGRVVACVVILLLAVLGMMALVASRKPPVKAKSAERAVSVQIQEARLEDVAVEITGYGEVRSRDVVSIAPEVAGRIVQIHPRLEAGEIIHTGEVLFKIDPRDYEARVADAKATIQQLEATVARLEKQYAIDRERLTTYERSRDLANDEYSRVRTLYEKDQVGTQSLVDTKEMAFNQADDAADQLLQTLDIFPIRIQEAQANLTSAKARTQLAEVSLERCVVLAAFDARIKTVNLESGQYVAPGVNVLTLADDSILEIPVSLNSREAREWLQFDTGSGGNGKAWFSQLKQVPVTVRWTEQPEQNRWDARLHRVERFDEQTRTLTVIVRVGGSKAVSPDEGSLPLVEGMFCKVTIPGRVATQVVRVPAECVGFDQDASGYRTVYVATTDEETAELRLHSRRVKESHIAGEYVFISDGLKDGDLIITTRLVNPLENTLVEALSESRPEMES